MSQPPRGGIRELPGTEVATLYPRSSRMWRVLMATIEKSIDVEVPVRAAYNQWTQFEDFPRFMEGVEEVKQVSDTRLHWIAEIAGVRREWDAEITEQTPDQRIAWKTTSGAQNDGVVIHRLEAGRTRIMLQ